MPSSPNDYCKICGALLHTQDCAICQAALCQQKSSDEEDKLLPQTLFHDRYMILEAIGEGGFGSVYKARDIQQHDRLVAIKEICLRGLSSQAIAEVKEASSREVRLLAQLAHPGLPRFYEHFHYPECWYIVMEFIEGQTLEDYLHQEPQHYIPLSEVLHIGLQLCAVLEYLHDQQPPIIFRDLKPGNIIRTADVRVYVIDFGIARRFKPGQRKDTTALGSPGYAAPEQYGRAQTTPRADIYSLGVVLYQLLTRKDPSDLSFPLPPLYADSHLAICDLVELVNRMISLDVEQRPASVTQIRQQLQHVTRIWMAIHANFGLVAPRYPY